MNIKYKIKRKRKINNNNVVIVYFLLGSKYWINATNVYDKRNQ